MSETVDDRFHRTLQVFYSLHYFEMIGITNENFLCRNPLSEKIMMMEPNVSGLPTAVNITASAEKEKIKFMYGTSVRSGIQTQTMTKKMLYENNRLIAMSSVRNIPILQWCHSNVVLTEIVIEETVPNRRVGRPRMDGRKAENTVSFCGPKSST
jgi:hypothetical protein